jgi:hypothetical protein
MWYRKTQQQLNEGIIMALIFTIKGDLEESTLVKKEGGHENDNEIVSWQEWYLGDELVKRDVQMHLKTGLDAMLAAGF